MEKKCQFFYQHRLKNYILRHRLPPDIDSRRHADNLGERIFFQMSVRFRLYETIYYLSISPKACPASRHTVGTAPLTINYFFVYLQMDVIYVTLINILINNNLIK